MVSKDLHTEIENILKKSLSLGVVGSAKDFYNWVIMDYELNSKKVPLIEENLIENILNDFLKQSFVTHGTFDPNEYIISENSPFYKKISSNDHYYIIGKANLSPIQYVRSRQISFLNQNNVSQDDIEEISIATTEAVENSVKYGDGEKVEISNFIENGKNFKLTMVNKIKEFDLQTEIDRGKYSSSITLMRGVLVMEKLFDKFDLILLDNNTQAMVQAEKN